MVVCHCVAMPLSSTSTPADIMAAYADNAAYEYTGNDGSMAMAQQYAIACQLLLMVMPKIAAQDRASMSLSPELIAGELKRVRNWIGMQRSGGQVVHPSFENFRGSGLTGSAGGGGV